MDPSYSKKSILGTPLADGAYAGAHILACLIPNLQKVTFLPGISTEPDINGLGPLQPWGQVSAQGHCKSPSHRGHLTNDSSFQLCVPPTPAPLGVHSATLVLTVGAGMGCRPKAWPPLSTVAP